MAVEAFDAWMIADGNAVSAAGGDGSRSHPDPEKLSGKEGTGSHPKDRAAEIFGGHAKLTEAYMAVADNVDLEVLAKACPRGFEPFAEDVREKIRPAVGQA